MSLFENILMKYDKVCPNKLGTLFTFH